MPNPGQPLFTRCELAFRTQYGELKDRVVAAGALLRGTPGSLVRRSATGRAYWYRAYQSATGRQVEDLVGRDADVAAHGRASDDIEFARWVATQVRTLRRLGFQVADKAVAQVLVELHNSKLFEAGLCVVGTLAYMAWLNELGALAVAARTQDVDLAARQPLELAAPLPLLDIFERTQLGFHPVPGLSRTAPSSSLKLPGAAGLRVDLLAHGSRTGTAVAVPQLGWHAQAVAHYDYLLQQTQGAAMLAGTHCVPVRVPELERFIWHKLYSSAVRKTSREKAAKDLRQAATLAAALIDEDEMALSDSAHDLPTPMRSAIQRHRGAIRAALVHHTKTCQAIEEALAAADR